jgi:hypothetical protein
MNAQFPHALHNILSKRRKSENIDVPLNTSGNSSHSPHSNNNDDRNNSHNNNQIKSENSPKSEHLINDVDDTKIKCEPNVSSDQNENEIDFQNHDLRRELLGSSKKTMNDVLKLLTNKMRGSSIKEGRKDSTEDFDGKT